MKDGGLTLKRDEFPELKGTPDANWFWRNRERIWRILPEMVIEMPENYKPVNYKEKKK